jgi:hypothetical protein
VTVRPERAYDRGVDVDEAEAWLGEIAKADPER